MTHEFTGWDSVQDSSAVPSGSYQLAVERLDQTTSAKGKLMYKGQFRVIEPKEFENMPIFETFVIGSDDDPGAEDPETWTSQKAVAVRILKGLFTAAKLDMRHSISQLVHEVVGSQVMGVVRLEKEPEKQRDGSTNQYAGQERNRVGKFMALDGRGVQLGASPTIVSPVRPAAPARPVVSSGARPMPPPPPAPPATNVQAASRPARPKELMIPCSVCDQAIPRSQWAAHEASHETTAEAPAG